jgi:hypothetical protein
MACLGQRPDLSAHGGRLDLGNGYSKDWTQNNNVAAANPAKLKELQDLFWVEADKYQVLPLDASGLERFIAPRPSIVAGRDVFTYTRPIVGIPQESGDY